METKGRYKGIVKKCEQLGGQWRLILTNAIAGYLPSPYARDEEFTTLIKLEPGMKITFDFNNNTFNKIIVSC